ncbi:MAG: YiiX family permuted papain-like enzyme [Parvicellaceae bacterium]
MKKILLTILTIGILAFLVYWGTEMYQFADGVKKDAVRLENFKLGQSIQNGDIIFQTSQSSQSKAIQLATDSKYSHMGIIYENDGQFLVYEAVQPVKLTPLTEWINRGENGHYVIKRLENADQVLTSSTLSKMKQIGEQFKGKPYDIYFEWSDDKIYCSELVWKMYKQATNIEIGKLEQLSDFDLSNETVKAKMKERYGSNIPMDEKVISPAAMFNSDKLITIEEK